MKRFFIWFIFFFIFMVIISISTHFYMSSNLKKIVIAVDSSYNMINIWDKTVKEVERYCNNLYTKYSLITDKFLIHSWQDKVLQEKLNNIRPYGPRELDVFYDTGRYKEVEEANIVYIFTNDNNFKPKDSKYKVVLIK